MIISNKRIGFIGAGNMAEAMIGAIINTSTADPADIFLSDIDSNRLNHLRSTYGVRPLHENSETVKNSNIVIFAVKPQQIDSVLAGLAREQSFDPPSDRKLFVSIAAGIRLETFENVIYETLSPAEKDRMPIMRVMPNTPALVQAGMCAVCANSHATHEDFALVEAILSAMGKVMVFDETKMDAITAVSGSGPAYCFYMLEAVIAAGEQLGLAPDDAAALAITTFSGAIKLLEVKNEAPESLRRKVTSPGGTTEAAIRVLEDRNFKSAVIDAITAAAERSRQLSRGK